MQSPLGQAVARTDAEVVALIVLALAAAAGFAIWRAWVMLHRARTIEDTPTAKIRSAPQGYVELEGVGRLMEGPPIIAPLSGLRCVWYRYRVEQQEIRYERGRLRHRWRVIEHGESRETFWLDDGTGRVVVDPEGAAVLPRHKDVWKSHTRLRPTDAPDALARRLAALPAGEPYRFTEERINTGDPLYALGRIKNISSHADMPTVDAEVRDVLREWKANQPALKARFDLNRDGHIDEREWMLVRAQTRREVHKARRETQRQFADGINLLGPTGERERPYLISGFTQSELLRRARRGMALYGAAFFILGGAAVWLYNVRFHA